jgi:hypothetical protein
MYTPKELRIARQYGRASGLDRALILVAAYLRVNVAAPVIAADILRIIEGCKIEPKSSHVNEHQHATPGQNDGPPTLDPSRTAQQ